VPASLGASTWRSLAAADPPVVVIPLGSCEQHGPHLPLDTDTRIAVTLAGELADRRARVLVAPAFGVGASWEHDGFPGLLSVTAGLLTELLVEVVRSADWASGVVLVSGHGGNVGGLAVAVDRLRKEGRDVLAWCPTNAVVRRVIGEAGRHDHHAGRSETSILLALDHAAVDEERLETGWTGPLEDVLAASVKTLSPNGVLGDPTGASAEEGWLLLDALADDLVTSYDRWRA
jgi:mycofactocin precursor peptide peptidase